MNENRKLYVIRTRTNSILVTILSVSHEIPNQLHSVLASPSQFCVEIHPGTATSSPYAASVYGVRTALVLNQIHARAYRWMFLSSDKVEVKAFPSIHATALDW
jgi:hypothetical protein